MTLTDYDEIRAEVKTAAQSGYVAALIAADAERAVFLLEASLHGSLAEDVLLDLGFDEAAAQIYP